jgi:hypothetical protein
MKEAVVAAIVSAINAYIEQEEQARIIPSKVTPYPEISPWRFFGRQELMRARTRWHVRRTNR